MSATPRQYRKRPIEMTAVRWTGSNGGVIEAFTGWSQWGSKRFRTVYRDGEDLLLWIEKSETRGRVRKGDWVIAELDGAGFFPCTAEQFDVIYEPVEE